MQKAECRSERPAASTSRNSECSSGNLVESLWHSSQLWPARQIDYRFMGGGRDLKDRTKQFALRVMRLYRALPRREDTRVVGRQLLRSGTSVGANYRAACRARSKAEFLAKLGIVLEEADETVYWLELLQESNIMSPQELGPLVQEARELTSIFVASICTARGSQNAEGRMQK